MDADDARSREVTDSPADIHDGVPPDKSSDGDDRYSAVTQYSLAQILGVWAAGEIPMAVLHGSLLPGSETNSRVLNRSLRRCSSASRSG